MTPVLIAIPLGLACFASVWCLTLWLVSRFGWSTLASHHRHEGPPLANRVAGQFARINLARYRDVLAIGWDSQAIYLDTSWAFRPGHPTLRIPFSSIVTRTQVQGAEVLGVRAGDKTVKVTLAPKSVAPFSVYLPQPTAASH